MSSTKRPSILSRPIFIAEIEQFGGAERSLIALARWLHERELPAYLLTYADHCNLAQYASFPVEVFALNPASGARSRLAALRDHFAQLPPFAPKPLASGYQAAMHLTLIGERGFHTLMHDTSALLGDNENRSIKNKLRIALCNKVIGFGLRSGGNTMVNSEFLKADCRKDFGITAQITRMGGLSSRSTQGAGVDGEEKVESKKRQHSIIDGKFRILSVCRIENNKRIDWILRSLAELEGDLRPLSHLTDWCIDFAGKGSKLDELQELAGELKIADRVKFHGFVPDSELAKLYSRADLFLMPAVQGYGIPAVEAIDRGIPVLLHRESGVSDVLRETPWAKVFSGGPHDLTIAFGEFIRSILKRAHAGVPKPKLPTEEEWASQIATLSDWL